MDASMQVEKSGNIETGVRTTTGEGECEDEPPDSDEPPNIEKSHSTSKLGLPEIKLERFNSEPPASSVRTTTGACTRSRSIAACQFISPITKQKSLLFLTSISLEQSAPSLDKKSKNERHADTDAAVPGSKQAVPGDVGLSVAPIAKAGAHASPERGSGAAVINAIQNKAHDDGSSLETPPEELQRRQNSFNFLSNISLGQDPRPAKGRNRKSPLR